MCYETSSGLTIEISEISSHDTRSVICNNGYYTTFDKQYTITEILETLIYKFSKKK